MLIQKYVKITVKDNVSTLDEELYFYRRDRNINVMFEINNFNFEFLDKEKFEEENIVNIINPSYSTIRIIKPNGQQIVVTKCPIENGLVHFYIDSEFIDAIDEVGIYQLQITLYGKEVFTVEEDSRITIPPITFEVIEPIFDDDIDQVEGIVSSEEYGTNRRIVSDCNVHNNHANRTEIKEGTDLYEWYIGDWITDGRLNSIHYNILKLYDKVEGKLDASTISYGLNGLETVQDALNVILSPSLEIKIFNVNIATLLEKGVRVNYCNFSWSYSKDVIVSQFFNDEIGDVSLSTSLRTYRYETPFSSNKKFTLKVNDGKDTKTSTISIRFCSKVFWGTSIVPSKYDSDFLNILTYELSDSRKRNINVQANSGQYIYYATPISYGECVFSVGGFVGGFDKVATVTYTNQYNYTESYNIYMSDNPSLGNTTVTIS